MRLDKGMRYLSAMVLMGALAVPVGLQAQEHNGQDRDDQSKAEMRHDKNNSNRRWTSNEEPYYRQWYSQTYNGREYRDYNRLNKRDRDAYWNWRQQHNDRDRDRDDHRDKDHDRDHHDKDHDRDHR
jgi:hypothetical protein